MNVWRKRRKFHNENCMAKMKILWKTANFTKTENFTKAENFKKKKSGYLRKMWKFVEKIGFFKGAWGKSEKLDVNFDGFSTNSTNVPWTRLIFHKFYKCSVHSINFLQIWSIFTNFNVFPPRFLRVSPYGTLIYRANGKFLLTSFCWVNLMRMRMRHFGSA